MKEKETNVRICTFCKKPIENFELLVYTEDEEAAHYECLMNFEQHWEDRTDYMDLIGY